MDLKEYFEVILNDFNLFFFLVIYDIIILGDSMKNKKGFTLVELIAIVAILGMIALISVPSINKLSDKSSKKKLESTAYGLIDSAKIYYSNMLIEHPEGISGEFTFRIDENIDDLDYKGKLPKKGFVKIDENGKVMVQISDDYYCAYNETFNGKIIVKNYETSICE